MDPRVQLDKVIHERSRLAILSYLAASEAPNVAFTELRERLELSAGNLSVHLRNLEEAGYITIAKSFVANRPNTSVRLTPQGNAALSDYLEEMDALIQRLRRREDNGNDSPARSSTQKL